MQQNLLILASGLVRSGNDELRLAELAILDGPVPDVPFAEETRLIAADPSLAAALSPCRASRCRVSGCSPLCDNCQVRRRYLALLLHREAWGKVRPWDVDWEEDHLAKRERLSPAPVAVPPFWQHPNLQAWPAALPPADAAARRKSIEKLEADIRRRQQALGIGPPGNGQIVSQI